MSEQKFTKAEIVQRLVDDQEWARRDAEDIVDLLLETIKDSLISGKNVKVSGFGCFEVRSKLARKGRNPQTGVEMTLPARRVVRFRPSEVLKAALNSEAP